MSATAPHAQASPRVETIGANLRRHWRAYGGGAVFLLISNWCAVRLPVLFGQGLDRLKALQDKAGAISPQQAMNDMKPLVMLMVALGTAQLISRVLSRFLVFNAGRRIEYEIRGRLFAHALTLPVLTLHRLGVGDIMSRLTNDLGNVRAALGFGFLNVVNMPVLLVLALWQMWRLSPPLMGLALLPLVLVFFVVRRYGGPLFSLSRDIGMRLGKMTGWVQESLAQITTTRLYHQEEARERAFARQCEEYVSLNLKAARNRGVLFEALPALVTGGTLLVLVVGGWLVMQGRVSLGQYVAFFLFVKLLDGPVRMFGFVFSSFQRGRAGFGRVNEILLIEPDLTWGGTTDASRFAQGFAARDVSLALGGRVVLDHVSLTVAPGEMVGLTGPVGSGKTALLNLLARAMDPSEGTVAVGGVAAGAFTAGAYHAGVGYCTQEPFLFADTLRENIRFARPDASDDEVLAMAQLAGLGEDMTRFPDGIDTLVGERGITLSGGQKQRVGLARALMVQTPLLLLDDSFSAVDTVTEEKIIEGLRQTHRQGRRTILFATHRLSAMPHCDRVVVLEKGRIVQQGTHGELLAQPGLYADLWRRQKLEEELEEKTG